MRALVLDDSKAMRSLLSRTMKKMGFDVLEAGDGCAGMRYLEQTGPLDLALVDWNMPEMNGLEFLRLLRANPVFNRMRVMIVTSEIEMNRMSEALAAGADEYVMKPFTPEILFEKLRILGMVEG